MPDLIHIEIVGADNHTLCQTECNISWSQPEIQAQAKNDIRKRFGDHVKLDFINVKDAQEQFKNESTYPLLIINNQIRMSGQFDIKKLMDIIEIQVEIGDPVQ